MSEEPAEPGPKQEEVIRRVNDHTTAEIERLADFPNHEERIAALEGKYDALAQAVADALDAVSALRTDMEAADTALHERIDEHRVLIDALAAMQATTASQVTDHENRIKALEDVGPPGPGSWQDSPDLIDASFRPVLGVHTGGDGARKSDPVAIAGRIGKRIQAAPIYWKNAGSPKVACERMLTAGTIPRLEICFPHIVTSSGGRMAGDVSFWARVGRGDYDDTLGTLLAEVGALDRPILLSMGHESDLRSEDGASPKNAKPPSSTYCGAYEDFPGYWSRFAELAKGHAPKARLFLNLSGGYTGAGGTWDKDAGEWLPGRWDAMLPPADTFDFFGWDPYNRYGVDKGANWDPFETRLKMFGRWDWYKRTIPNVPVIIGETATCQGPGGDKDAGPWLLDMIEFMVENRWQGVGTGGGISQIHYFSHHYPDHPRCLDEPHGGTGQMWAVLPQIGADARLSWAE